MYNSNKKDSLYYKVNEIPPIGIIFLASVQHLIAMFAGVIICPLIVASALNFNQSTTLNFVSLAVVASAIGTFLQSVRFGPIGSGFLSIIGSSGTFISISIAAGLEGGVSLICGMTLLGAPLKIILSFFAGTLHKYFPPYIRGAFIILIGLSILKISINQVFDIRHDIVSKDFALNVLIAFVVFASTLLCARFKYFFRITSVMMGILCGTLLSMLLGRYNIPVSGDLPIFMVPRFFHTSLSFSWNHLIPFLIAYFITTIETLGDTYTLTEISLPPENKISSKRIRGGIIASGLASLISGAIGTMASTTYSGNVAIIKITGVASRVIGVITSLFLFLIAFFPFFAKLLASLPRPVVGGSIFVAILFMVQIGFKIVKVNSTKFQKKLTFLVLAIALFLIFFSNFIPANVPARELIINPICSCTILLILLHFIFCPKTSR